MIEYFAGLIDSDGWIGRRKKRIRIIVGNTVDAPLHLLKKYFGGYLYLGKKKKVQHKDFWFWETMLAEDDARLLKLNSHLVEKANKCPSFISDEYAAGMFDGDGTVTTRKQTKGNGQYLCVELYSDYRPILEAFKNTYRGTIYPNYRGGKSERWAASCSVAEEFLRRVMPFLIIKHERAERSLELRRLNLIPKTIQAYGPKNGYKLKEPIVMQQMRDIKADLLAMNRLGC